MADRHSTGAWKAVMGDDGQDRAHSMGPDDRRSAGARPTDGAYGWGGEGHGWPPVRAGGERISAAPARASSAACLRCGAERDGRGHRGGTRITVHGRIARKMDAAAHARGARTVCNVELADKPLAPRSGLARPGGPARTVQRPSKRAVRLARNACVPSRASALPKQSAKACCSSSRP